MNEDKDKGSDHPSAQSTIMLVKSIYKHIFTNLTVKSTKSSNETDGNAP